VRRVPAIHERLEFPISLARINGVLLLLAGVWLIQRN
jgi:hypothetical protein